MYQTGPEALIVLAVIAAVIIAIVAATVYRKKQKAFRMRIENGFGQIPYISEEAMEYAPNYWKERLSHTAIAHFIDDVTWDDLDMDKIFARLDGCQTTIGDEYLYALLREPQFDPAGLLKRESLITLMDSDPKLRLDIEVLLARMGKSEGNGLSYYCFDVSSKKIKNPFIYNILAVLPIALLGFIFLNTAAGLLGFFGCFVLNLFIYYFTKKRIERDLSAIEYFTTLLWCTEKIRKTCAGRSNEILDDLFKGFSVFKNLRGKLSGISKQKVTDVDFIVENFRIIFLTSIRHYNKIITIVENHMEDFNLLFKSFGELECAINILSFRKSLPFHTYPEFGEDQSIVARDIYHPLLLNPVPNTAALSKSILVSGSNASGKSTFIKAVAINGILAQTIYTCTANRFKIRPALVITSMAVRDDISAGESYFITEIKSIKRIIQKIEEISCLCVIDEILKGTNTVERIAASASVLRFINGRSCTCIVATHDIELTYLLAGLYENFHFSEQITDEGVYFDYKIKDGPSKTKNAIKLLGFMGYGEEIVRDADALVRNFEEKQVWEL